MTTPSDQPKPATEQKHGEPWQNKHLSAEIYDASGEVIANNPRQGPADYVKPAAARLRRATACVNAMSGLNPEALPAAIQVLETIDAWYSGSLDHRPPYVKAAREALNALKQTKL